MNTYLITEEGHGTYRLRMDYSAAGVSALKSAISFTFRTWDAGDKVWLIEGRTNATAAARVLQRQGYRGEGPPDPEPPPAPRADVGTQLRDLIKGVGTAYRSRVLRTLAAGAHPDAGGDPELSRAVNALREEIDR